MRRSRDSPASQFGVRASLQIAVIEDILVRTSTSALALVLTLSGLMKLRDRWRFIATVRTWQVFSPSGARVVAAFLPMTELAVGILGFVSLVAPPLAPAARMTIAGMFGLFTVGQMVILIRAKSAACGCFGKPHRIGQRSIARSGLLFGLSLVPFAAFAAV